MARIFTAQVSQERMPASCFPSRTLQSPIEGTATLTENQAGDLLAGKWYANIHTAANPGAELRGQMVK